MFQTIASSTDRPGGWERNTLRTLRAVWFATSPPAGRAGYAFRFHHSLLTNHAFPRAHDFLALRLWFPYDRLGLKFGGI